jgi:hypothetical protein
MREICLVALVVAVSACGDGAPTNGTGPSLVVGAWDGAVVSSLCVTGEEDYGAGKNAFTPLQDGLSQVLPDGVVVAEGCDATVTVITTGRPRSATYTGAQSGTFYSGAQVSGFLVLGTPGRDDLVATVDAEMQPPDKLDARLASRTPQGAPYWSAAWGDVCRAVLDWFADTDPEVFSDWEC